MTFLMDRGFVTNKNLKNCEEMGVKYLCAIDMKLINALKELKKNKFNISSQFTNDAKETYYGNVLKVPGHNNRRLVIIFSHQRYDNDIAKFNK